MPQGSIPYEAVLVPPVSPYRSSPYEAVPPPLPGTYSQGTPGVGPPMAEPAGNSRVQLTIVGAQVGAVLGRNGTNISQIRQVRVALAVVLNAAVSCKCKLQVQAATARIRLGFQQLILL